MKKVHAKSCHITAQHLMLQVIWSYFVSEIKQMLFGVTRFVVLESACSLVCYRDTVSFDPEFYLRGLFSIRKNSERWKKNVNPIRPN